MDPVMLILTALAAGAALGVKDTASAGEGGGAAASGHPAEAGLG
jgi:hypothetical protein